ncbi:ornithine cyclodeaminase [Scopulibacillus daqui]|uniref:Ornithine cyclodeaminase n=1 Tax=Scopulibacillus daqui TaxID=1469162 RepID=A0ABS2Q509_9BACL|nr:ornithine cyclodeaminase family protein [Scopulibacillus daqui]MBM7647035.1 ornithine cyclodeaminase [Scopulibacillus daqui]
MLAISKSDIKKSVTMNEMIDAMATALIEYSKARTTTPVRTALPVSKARGNALFMPSLAESIGGLGIKVVSVFPENKKLNKEPIQGIVLLLDFKTGEPLALIEGSYLTVLRTGALSGLATKYLARSNAHILSVIGTGAQARGLVEAMLCVRPISEIRLFNRTSSKADRFKQELSSQYRNLKITVCHNADEAVQYSDILVTATNAETPIFTVTQLKPGLHINAVGSYRPEMQEIPSFVLETAEKVVVESKEAVLEETGDLITPIKEGRFAAENIYGELGQIAGGIKSGRENDQEMTFFKSVGLAVADIAAAKLIYERAIKTGLGQKIALTN